MAKILVVDDEPDVLFTVRIALEVVGHEVIEAPERADGSAAGLGVP
jgi:DNA-binding response OmpR family regulator